MFCASSLKPGGALLELNQRLEVGEATDLKEEGNRTGLKEMYWLSRRWLLCVVNAYTQLGDDFFEVRVSGGWSSLLVNGPVCDANIRPLRNSEADCMVWRCCGWHVLFLRAYWSVRCLGELVPVSYRAGLTKSLVV